MRLINHSSRCFYEASRRRLWRNWCFMITSVHWLSSLRSCFKIFDLRWWCRFRVKSLSSVSAHEIAGFSSRANWKNQQGKFRHRISREIFTKTWDATAHERIRECHKRPAQFFVEKVFFDRSKNRSCAVVMTFRSLFNDALVLAKLPANDPNTTNTLVPAAREWKKRWTERHGKKQISHSTRWLIAIHIPLPSERENERC